MDPVGFDPHFLDIDSQIKEVEDYINNHQQTLWDIDSAYTQRHRDITAQIAALQQKLRDFEVKTLELRRLEKEKFNTKHKELAALRRQKAEEAANKAMESTVALIKEICENFDSWSKAREYQVEDVVRIVHQFIIGSSGVMNANEMALGKTFETLVALFIIQKLIEKEKGRKARILWLTKASILQTGGTQAEAERWYPELKMFPITGSDDKSTTEFILDFAVETGGICIIANYEAVRTHKKFKTIEWDVLVMDEVHKLKGGANYRPTAIWESVKALTVGFQIMLTGTPLVNKMEEIWSYLHLFDPMAFPDSKQFARQFSAFKDVSGKLKFDLRSENLLRDILRGKLIRRTAAEIGLQLPKEVWQDIVLPHNEQQARIYTQMRDQFFVWLDEQRGALSATSILAQLTRLRQINVLPVANFKTIDANGNEHITKLDVRDSSKLDQAVEIILETNDQVIVGCNFNEPLEELCLRLQVEGLKVEIISSKYSHQMGEYEKRFQQKDIDVLLLNLSMGEGLNLHKDIDKWPGGARAVIFLDFWWNNASNDQFYKRAVRPGTNDGQPVFIYKLFCKDSVDYFLQALCDEKAQQFEVFTEDKGLRPSDDWKSYLKGLL